MIIPISYPLTLKTPLYPNTPALVIHPVRSMKQGDSANTSLITFSTHSGTHIDAPSHFCKEGKTIADYLTVDTKFFPTYCIDLPKPESGEICVSDLSGITVEVHDAEAILIRTGWYAIRLRDPERYCNDHPWISPEIPRFLSNTCPKLRVFGIDQISVSSIFHRETGKECHRRFLCCESPILLLEDVDLSDKRLMNGKYSMHIYPYLIGVLDGTPVVVIMEKI